jgi:Caspase domain/Domain of unknown function (DUF4384)
MTPLVSRARYAARAALAATLALAAGAALGQAAPAAPAERNTRHALIIGIGQYADPSIPTLKGVPHDLVSARRMAAAMAVPEANMRVLRDGEATADRIRLELAKLRLRVADGDRIFIYYSGHGTRWAAGEDSASGDCVEGLMAADGRVLTNSELGERLAPLARKADKMLVFYDACFSGGVAAAPFRTRSWTQGGAEIVPRFTAAGAPARCAQPSNFRARSLAGALQQQQTQPQNVVHVAASRPDEVSFDSSAQGGFATAAWRDCLLGQAGDLDGSGAITVDEITRCAQAKVNTALAGQPGILGQQMTVAGNAGFVPAWMGAAFTAAAAAPAPAAAQPAPASPAQLLAELHGQRDGTHGVEATARRPQLKIGTDTLQLDITPERDGHLYVALAGADGTSLYLLFPNELARDNRVRAGQRLSLPGPGWEVVAAGPPGTETLLVMVTDAPRDLSRLAAEKSGPFMKTLLDRQGRARLQELLAGGTPAAGCGQPGRPACSDAFGSALLRVRTVP